MVSQRGARGGGCGPGGPPDCRRGVSGAGAPMFFFSSRRRHTRFDCDWSSDVCSSDLGLQRVLGLGSYRTAWSWLHKLRRAMVRAGRDRLTGWVEVDETYLGGLEEGRAGRGRKSVV